MTKYVDLKEFKVEQGLLELEVATVASSTPSVWPWKSAWTMTGITRSRDSGIAEQIPRASSLETKTILRFPVQTPSPFTTTWSRLEAVRRGTAG